MPVSKFVAVGLDGSPEARVALEYAAEEARLRGTQLKVVTAFAFPQYTALGQAYPVLVTPEQIEADVVAASHRIVDQVLAGVEHPPPVAIAARPGGAAQVLIECATGAEMLVIGHRGRGALASTTLGSVGLHCVLHARCPVTVVRGALQRETAREPAAAAIPARRAATATS